MGKVLRTFRQDMNTQVPVIENQSPNKQVPGIAARQRRQDMNAEGPQKPMSEHKVKTGNPLPETAIEETLPKRRDTLTSDEESHPKRHKTSKNRNFNEESQNGYATTSGNRTN
jgi:hypothetical protein